MPETGKFMTKQECYDKIVMFWGDLKWSSYIDTFDMRSKYRKELHQKKEEKKPKRPRKSHAPEQPAADADPESEAGETAHPPLMSASKIRRMVRETIAEEQQESRGASCSAARSSSSRRSDAGALQSLGKPVSYTHLTLPTNREV